MDMEVDKVDSFINSTRNNQESFEYNWQSLQSNMKVLNGIALEIEVQVKEAETRKRKRDVENWCEEVGKIKNQFLKLQKDLLEKCISEVEETLCVINSGIVGLIEQSKKFRQLFVDVHHALDDQEFGHAYLLIVKG
ncbi:hypothetical protein RND71_014980 [Anisodus tanguticus]|uniref:Uncharacterized protein n=1 Tax=Anisodus tanguticus TaxID=243964 RepID=A0AAE1SC97_9SOLA|nr:hypothetical protein RND71_014980 [Anisodus tanguticus]